MIEDIFGILVIVSVNVINHVMLVSTWVISCKCRKRLVAKLMEECNKIVEEVKIIW